MQFNPPGQIVSGADLGCGAPDLCKRGKGAFRHKPSAQDSGQKQNRESEQCDLVDEVKGGCRIVH